MAMVSFGVLTLAAVLGAALLSMIVYATLRPPRDADAAKKGTSFLLGFGSFLLNWFLWAIAPAERLVLALGATPDHMNVAGLLGGMVAGVLLAFGYLEAGGWAIAVAGVADILDGRLARRMQLASPYGKFIDSTLDRFVEAFTLLGAAWYLRDRPAGAFVAGAALAGSLLVSYAQARGETVGVSGSGGLMQRAERLVLTCLACLLDPMVSRRLGVPGGTLLFCALVVIAVPAWGTAVYRTVWIARKLR
jgi:CDP-diacylglycerol---glycerol-3-phosphate 3-phosphatidyltransferase